MEWLVHGMQGLLKLIEDAQIHGAPITADNIETLKSQAERLAKLIEGMQPQ